MIANRNGNLRRNFWNDVRQKSIKSSDCCSGRLQKTPRFQRHVDGWVIGFAGVFAVLSGLRIIHISCQYISGGHVCCNVAAHTWPRFMYLPDKAGLSAAAGQEGEPDQRVHEIPHYSAPSSFRASKTR
jgi:hypothetical protein